MPTIGFQELFIIFAISGLATVIVFIKVIRDEKEKKRKWQAEEARLRAKMEKKR